ncbi:MAG: efflux RND transporter periplasmic adaptor subunit [Flavobacteriaceae bacterium]|nr:efflux RND transporter periplasmic adaptor subunit [Flavobacteriaceae bacterium]
MKHLKKISILLLFSLITMSCGEDTKQFADSEIPSISVTTLKVGTSDTQPYISVSGTVEAGLISNLSTRVMGYVTDIPFELGDEVKKGDVIVKLSTEDLLAKRGQVNSEINSANAAFENARKDYDRFTSLFSNNSASQKELDDAKMRSDMASARLSSAKEMKAEVNAQFAYANIRAPFSGSITSKFINEGDLANPGMPLVTIENSDDFEIQARIPEHLIGQVKKGMRVMAMVKSIGENIQGEITQISSSSINTGGQYLIKVKLEDHSKSLQSGMFASVNIPVENPSMETPIYIPKSALVKRGQLSGVFTVSQSETAILRWLRLGEETEELVEVLSGLSAGESIVLSSEARLFNGSKINISNSGE